mmetsp:Transcript_19735/g.65738  ORF Transcript_19735/g.65738 Transcript_19735/m.65738 type:complete len:103 (+) Transcript_19735:1245-1553(+)
MSHVKRWKTTNKNCKAIESNENQWKTTNKISSQRSNEWCQVCNREVRDFTVFIIFDVVFMKKYIPMHSEIIVEIIVGMLQHARKAEETNVLYSFYIDRILVT